MGRDRGTPTGRPFMSTRGGRNVRSSSTRRSPGRRRQFAQEAGLVAYFRPLSGAKPMGKGKFELSILQWQTNIDDHDAAWNDTFVHPDSGHYLFEGSGLKFPGLMARAGVSGNTDVGVYYTRNPNANYGFYGAQVQRNFLGGSEGDWAAATRVSFTSLFGREDVDFTVIGWDVGEAGSCPQQLGGGFPVRRVLELFHDGARAVGGGGPGQCICRRFTGHGRRRAAALGSAPGHGTQRSQGQFDFDEDRVRALNVGDILIQGAASRRARPAHSRCWPSPWTPGSRPNRRSTRLSRSTRARRRRISARPPALREPA